MSKKTGMKRGKIYHIDGVEKKLNDKGYVCVRIGRSWKSEHILVVEDYIRRFLNNEEVVHHIDSNKQNNSIENLMLFPTQKLHAKFHIKIRQFGMTNPIKKQIAERWNAYISPSNKISKVTYSV